MEPEGWGFKPLGSDSEAQPGVRIAFFRVPVIRQLRRPRAELYATNVLGEAATDEPMTLTPFDRVKYDASKSRA